MAFAHVLPVMLTAATLEELTGRPLRPRVRSPSRHSRTRRGFVFRFDGELCAGFARQRQQHEGDAR